MIRNLSSPKYTKPHTFIVWGEVFQDFYALQRLLWFSPSWHIYQTTILTLLRPSRYIPISDSHLFNVSALE